jgi:hypothetical protein
MIINQTKNEQNDSETQDNQSSGMGDRERRAILAAIRDDRRVPGWVTGVGATVDRVADRRGFNPDGLVMGAELG